MSNLMLIRSMWTLKACGGMQKFINGWANGYSVTDTSVLVQPTAMAPTVQFTCPNGSVSGQCVGKPFPMDLGSSPFLANSTQLLADQGVLQATVSSRCMLIGHLTVFKMPSVLRKKKRHLLLRPLGASHS